MARTASIRSHRIAATVVVGIVALLAILVLLGVIGGRGGEEKGESMPYVSG